MWEYEPALETAVGVKSSYLFYMGGKWIAPSKRDFIDFINPTTEEKFSKSYNGLYEDLELAIKNAKDCFHSIWSSYPEKKRGEILFRISNLISEKVKELCSTETMSCGIPFRYLREMDIPLISDYFFYYAGWADKLNYLFNGKIQKPKGIIGIYVNSLNSLVSTSARVAAALSTGNSVVLMCNEKYAPSLVKMCEIFEEADLPSGVANLIVANEELCEDFLTQQEFSLVELLGSKDLFKLKNIHLNNNVSCNTDMNVAHIIFDDAPLDQAIEGIVTGLCSYKYLTNRLVVEENILEIFILKLQNRLNTIKLGNPFDKNCDLGPLPTKKHYDEVFRMIAIGEKEGGSYFEASQKKPVKGFFHLPGYFTNLAASSSLYRCDFLSPILLISSFRYSSEALIRANDTLNDFVSSIWTLKGSKGLAIVKELNSSVNWVNSFGKFEATTPYGKNLHQCYGGIEPLFRYVEEI